MSGYDDGQMSTSLFHKNSAHGDQVMKRQNSRLPPVIELERNYNPNCRLQIDHDAWDHVPRARMQNSHTGGLLPIDRYIEEPLRFNTKNGGPIKQGEEGELATSVLDPLVSMFVNMALRDNTKTIVQRLLRDGKNYLSEVKKQPTNAYTDYEKRTGKAMYTVSLNTAQEDAKTKQEESGVNDSSNTDVSEKKEDAVENTFIQPDDPNISAINSGFIPATASANFDKLPAVNNITEELLIQWANYNAKHRTVTGIDAIMAHAYLRLFLAGNAFTQNSVMLDAFCRKILEADQTKVDIPSAMRFFNDFTNAVPTSSIEKNIQENCARTFIAYLQGLKPAENSQSIYDDYAIQETQPASELETSDPSTGAKLGTSEGLSEDSVAITFEWISKGLRHMVAGPPISTGSRAESTKRNLSTSDSTFESIEEVKSSIKEETDVKNEYPIEEVIPDVKNEIVPEKQEEKKEYENEVAVEYWGDSGNRSKPVRCLLCEQNFKQKSTAHIKGKIHQANLAKLKAQGTSEPSLDESKISDETAKLAADVINGTSDDYGDNSISSAIPQTIEQPEDFQAKPGQLSAVQVRAISEAQNSGADTQDLEIPRALVLTQAQFLEGAQILASAGVRGVSETVKTIYGVTQAINSGLDTSIKVAKYGIGALGAFGLYKGATAAYDVAQKGLQKVENVEGMMLRYSDQSQGALGQAYATLTTPGKNAPTVSENALLSASILHAAEVDINTPRPYFSLYDDTPRLSSEKREDGLILAGQKRERGVVRYNDPASNMADAKKQRMDRDIPYEEKGYVASYLGSYFENTADPYHILHRSDRSNILRHIPEKIIRARPAEDWLDFLESFEEAKQSLPGERYDRFRERVIRKHYKGLNIDNPNRPSNSRLARMGVVASGAAAVFSSFVPFDYAAVGGTFVTFAHDTYNDYLERKNIRSILDNYEDQQNIFNMLTHDELDKIRSILEDPEPTRVGNNMYQQLT